MNHRAQIINWQMIHIKQIILLVQNRNHRLSITVVTVPIISTVRLVVMITDLLAHSHQAYHRDLIRHHHHIVSIILAHTIVKYLLE